MAPLNPSLGSASFDARGEGIKELIGSDSFDSKMVA